LQNRNDGRVLVLMVALLFCRASVCRAQSHPSTEGSPQAAAGQKAKSGPLSRADVLSFLDDIKHGIASEEEVKEKLSRGLDFRADTDTLDTLRKNGASEALIAEIKLRAKHEDPTATLSLNCAPAECRIKIDGQFAARTSDGHLDRVVKSRLPSGEVAIDFEKDGYVADQKIVKVGAEPGPPISLSVVLEPNLATRTLNGRKLYDVMVAALGGTAALNNLRSLTGNGSVTFYREGEPGVWDFDVSMAPAHLILMNVTGPAGGLVFGCNGEKCEEKKKGFLFIKRGKRLPEGVANDLEPNLRLVSRYDLLSVLETLNSKGISLMARTAYMPGKAQQRLRADGDDHVYEVNIGTDAWPISVEDTPKSGLGAVKVTYGNYVKVGDCNYPKQTTIRGAAQSGIEVRLNRIELGSKLRLSDFPK